MSIEQDLGVYVLRCDVCGDAANENFHSFKDAAQYVKDSDWKVEKRGGEWGDICPECQEG